MDRPIDTGALIDANRFSAFQIRVIALCALVYTLDGYDTLAIGFVVPQLAEAARTPLQAFGSVFSTGIIGTLIGTVTFGLLGDRIGRKWSLILTCFIFGVFSLLMLIASTYEQLLAIRFMASLGLGGATPIFVAMATEYAPKRLRGFAMAIVYSAFPFGGVLAGLASAFLVPRFGWTIMFVIGGLAPLTICALLVFALPESIRYLISKGGRDEAVHGILGRMGIELPHGTLFQQQGGPAKKVSLKQLLIDLPALPTALLWITSFSMFMVIVTLAVWTPTLLKSAGFSHETASLISTGNLFGGIIGTLGAGYVFDKAGAKIALLPQLFLTGALLALYGWAASMPAVLTIILMIEGLFVAGATTCLLALTGTLYSTPVRATGLGFALGAGRVGQIIGPTLVGMMLAGNMALPDIFLLAALPCFLAALAATALFGVLGTNRSAPRQVRTDLAGA